MTTDDLLMNLCAWGQPSVHRMDRGWWCRCTLKIAGATVHVDSETDHQLPRAAVLECAQRLRVYIESTVQKPPARLNTEEV